MKKIPVLFFALFLSYANDTQAQSTPPKREFRGAWIATVANLDWPSSPNRTETEQRSELIRILDELHEAGINAVFFQIRNENDALYRSEIEPWSYWLTGQQGKAPADFYDPLELAIDEAHKRGMELHAWFNPYRSVRSAGSYPLDSMHVSIRHPDWILTFGKFKILDPGLPVVRDYITSVILDVVRRYDIDGVHFDDFFYPYPPNHISNQDMATFQAYNRGFTNIGDWRRDNVNLFVKMVNDSIKAARPYVKFGISPFGIWKNGEPPGIVGLDAYNVIYADPLAWLGKEIVDYVAPQLYWTFGGGQDFGKLQPWWASQTLSNRHLYIGQAAHRISVWPVGEIQNQLNLNRSNPDVQGSIFFRALFFRENPRGFADFLSDDFYRYPALPLVMPWKDNVVPNNPRNLRYERIAGTGTAGLHWEVPEIAADGDSANRYVIYRFETAAIQGSDLDDPGKIAGLTYFTGFMPETPPLPNSSYFYLATALDRNNNESTIGAILQVAPPAVPLLAFPDNGAGNQPDGVELLWNYPPVAASYHIEVSKDSTFAGDLFLDEMGIIDTASVVYDMEGQQTYYWRVMASNAGGSSDFSGRFSFMTGFPATPFLAAPPTNTSDIPVDVTFRWHPALAGDSYRLQVSHGLSFESQAIVADVEGVVDTLYTLSQLEAERFHFWRVNAANDIGTSLWSEIWRFKTGTVTAIADGTPLPLQFELLQNYPNPFNPVTIVPFMLAKATKVQLKVYDILGREVKTLVDRNMPQGRYEIVFDGSELPSGIYLYRLYTNDFVSTKQMVLAK
jgi:uncharacterized lipoprotein YddW (UPF0748 family)